MLRQSPISNFTMFLRNNAALTLPSLLLLAACSSQQSTTVKDASDSEAGIRDASARLEVRIPDTFVNDLAATEAKTTDVRIDANSAVEANVPDSSGTSDTRPIAEVGSVGDVIDARDVSLAKDGPDAHLNPIDAGIDGGTNAGVDTGGVDLVPTANGTCAYPFLLSTTASAVDVVTSTTGTQHNVNTPCAQGGSDVVFRFQLETDEIVYAHTFGATWNTVLFLSEACPSARPASVSTGQVACSDDACGTPQSQVVAHLSYGVHYLILSGANGESGDATLHFEHVPVSSKPHESQLPAGSGTLTGTTSGNNVTTSCEASGPENCYWWTSCPGFAGGDFSATTCRITTWDTVLVLHVPRAGMQVCADDDPSCGRQSTLTATLPSGAGLNVLVVDGSNGGESGDYSVKYTQP
jgi:hypothetical protein